MTRTTTGVDLRDKFHEYRRTQSRQLRNELIEEHLELAAIYARRYQGRGVPSDDLEQVALFSILRAVERFDPDRGVEFSTYASRTIDGEIKRYFRDRTWSVRPPRRTQELHLELRRTEEDLVHRLGRSPTIAELADALDESVDHVLEALEAGRAHSATSIDQPHRHDADDRADWSDRVLAELDPRLGEVDSRIIVEDLLEKLPDRQRDILRMRFFENLSQTEIADRIGVSQSYLSRILRGALLDLRRALEDGR